MSNPVFKRSHTCVAGYDVGDVVRVAAFSGNAGATPDRLVNILSALARQLPVASQIQLVDEIAPEFQLGDEHV